MKFWDSSAIVPLLIDEPMSGPMRALFADDSGIVVTSLTEVEVASALSRRRRAGQLSDDAHAEAELLLEDLAASWVEIPVSREVISKARAVLARHALRAGDAVQLATAIIAGGTPVTVPFVSRDLELSAAARAEGFPTLP